MKSTKICLQCEEEFAGRSNQIYCSGRCKAEAFREGKTRSILPKSNSAVVPNTAVRLPESPSARTRHVGSDRGDAKAAKIQLEMRRLDLAHAQELRQIELDEENRRREHERALAQINAQTTQKESEIQKLTKQVDELTWKAMPALKEWSHFSVGIRRKYKALVDAAFHYLTRPISEHDCSYWLTEYRLYLREVEEFMKRNAVPVSQKKPFTRLAELSQELTFRRIAAQIADYDDDETVLTIDATLQQYLIQACV